MKVFYIVAGPNGAGKSSLTQNDASFQRLPIVDPDAIARKLNPGDVEKVAITAGRQALKEIGQYINKHQSFIWETTLSAKNAPKFVALAKGAGFVVELHFICLDGWKNSRVRVNERVTKGGHDIPSDIIKRRYERSLGNMRLLMPAVDKGKLYSNQTEENRVVAKFELGQIQAMLKDAPEWAKHFAKSGAQ